VPEHYTLTLTPDLKAATFSGVESIDVTVKEPASSITLNCGGDCIPVCDDFGGGQEQTATVVLDKGKEQATFSSLPRCRPARPRCRLRTRGF
jgi:hypothetical protein